jgi:hypothetical protein
MEKRTSSPQARRSSGEGLTRRIAAAVAVAGALLLAACGGGDQCATNTAAGPFLTDDLIAPVLITGRIEAPFVVTATARLEALKDGGQQIVMIGFAGDAYESTSLGPLRAGEVRDVRLEHRFTGGETQDAPVSAYFHTVAVLDNGDNRTAVRDVTVTACHVPAQ